MRACTSADESPAATGNVLVVDDHRRARESMADVLRQAGHLVDCCSSGAEALTSVNGKTYDCIVTDLKMPGMSGVELIVQLDRRQYPAQVVMVTAHASVSSAVQAIRHGAFDYIEKPFDVDQLEGLVGAAIRRSRMANRPSDSSGEGQPARPPVMIGSSPQMRLLQDKIAQIAPTPETVLISGESGTGKELVAQAIHAQSDRRENPLISLNCPVLSAQLMESELFGHEKGAFTGADIARTGRFESADGGSILLDEVTEMDLGLQAKLLRVLQERSFERVGSSNTVDVDVRVLATTNRDLHAEVTAGRFRQDLYFRLAVVPLTVPPLRDRREDVPELVDYFLVACADRLGRDPARMESAAVDLLVNYDWPGNVRELENLVTRASILRKTDSVAADDLSRWLIDCPRSGEQDGMDGVPVGLSLKEMERKMIEATLEHFDGHREKTAEALGIGVRTLSERLRSYGYPPRAKTFSRTT